MNTQVAAVQFAPRLGQPEANAERVVELVANVARRGVSLAVFPECSLSGYQLERDEAETAALDVPGPVTSRLGALSDALGITVVIGLLERASDGLYNTALTFVPGQPFVSYRKTHLPRMGVDRFCRPGGGPYLPVVTPVGRVGVLICYDLRFPEPSRILALAGAEVLAVPTNWPSTATDYPEFLLRARASENRLSIIAADRCGTELGAPFLGRSQIVSFDGTLIAEAGTGDETLVAWLDNEVTVDARRVAGRPDGPGGLLADRRDDLYDLTDRFTFERSPSR